MRLLRDDQVPATEVTHRESAAISLAFGLLLTGLAAAALALPLPVAEARSGFALLPIALIAVSLLLMGRIGIGAYRASRHPDAWLLRRGGDAVFLRFRSFHNWRFDPDFPTVVHLDGEEIAWVRPLIRALRERDGDGGWSSTIRVRHVEIGLEPSVDAGPLAEALRAESERRDSRGARTNHQPLSLSPAGTLLLEAARPGAVAAHFVGVAEARDAVVVDAREFDRMSAAERRAHGRELGRAGRTVSAAEALREAEGAEAVEGRG